DESFAGVVEEVEEVAGRDGRGAVVGAELLLPGELAGLRLPAGAEAVVGDEEEVIAVGDGGGDVGGAFRVAPEDVGPGDVAGAGRVDAQDVALGEAGGEEDDAARGDETRDVLLGRAVDNPE